MRSRVLLEGIARDDDSVNDLLSNLEHDNELHDVYLVGIDQSHQQDMEVREFQIQAVFKPVDKAPRWQYNPIDKRDPMRSFTNDAANTDITALTDLQRFDLDEMKMTGSTTPSEEGAAEEARALVEDPTGEHHVVKIGTYIGKNWGKVTEITRRCVVVKEEFLSMDGNLISEPIQLCMP